MPPGHTCRIVGVLLLIAAVLTHGSRFAAAEPAGPFIRMTDGDLATTRRDLSAPAWGDYDNDGDVDLYVAGFLGQDVLFKNNGDGTFTRQTAAMAGPIVGSGQISLGLWADFDNDGHLDMFRLSALGVERLFRSRGNGTFEGFTTSALSNDIVSSFGAAWGDFDGDGFVDLAVTVGDIDGGTYAPSQVLLRNESGGAFARVSGSAFGSIVTERGGGSACAWGDYDNDGDLDLFVGNNRTGANRAFLFRNDGRSGFTRITEGPVANDRGFPFTADWGDFDNDGDLDLFVGNARGLRNLLYRNLGDGQFARIDQGPVVEDDNATGSAAWADYDNDGFLDLFAANDPGDEVLYRGNGDGTFTRIAAFAGDNSSGNGTAWGDYDNDGFMDLFVANGGGVRLSYLYRNAGNANHWLKLKLIGTASNRSAIGAKVRVQARIRGREIWQLREVTGGHDVGQNDSRPNFGLGDATMADIVRIEWPSGMVQELRNVPASQIVDITEPARLVPSVLASGAQAELKVSSWPGFVLDVESSTDLKTWSPLGTVTNVNGTVALKDPEAATAQARFYRLANHTGLAPGEFRPIVHASGLKAPTKILRTAQGSLLVAEAGDGPNSGRVSLVLANGQRRTLLAGLPAGINAQREPSGVSGLALRERTLFVAIGEGDVLRLDANMNDISNPNPSSPILSSILSFVFSADVDTLVAGFTLTAQEHAALKSGNRPTLTAADGTTVTAELLADFPDITTEAGGLVRASNPFGAASAVFVLEISADLLNGAPGRLLRFATPTSLPEVVTSQLIGPTHMAFDGATRTLFISENFSGRIVRVGPLP